MHPKVEIGSLAISKSEVEPPDFTKYDIDASLDEVKTTEELSTLKFSFTILSDPKSIRLVVDGFATIFGKESKREEVLQNDENNIPKILNLIYQDLFPTLYMLTKSIAVHCPPYMLGTISQVSKVVTEQKTTEHGTDSEGVKTQEPITEEVKPEEIKTEEVKPEEIKTEEVKPEEIKTEEVEPEEIKTEEVKPEEKPTVARFVDPKKGPQHYIDRYNKDKKYKEWFEKNYPNLTIEEAVGLKSQKAKAEEPIAKEMKPEEIKT